MKSLLFHWIARTKSRILVQTNLTLFNILQKRGYWNYSWKYRLFFSVLPIHRKRDIKIRSCLRGSIEAAQREGSTYTIIRSRNLLGGRSLSILLPPVLSPLFFSVLFPSHFLRLPTPSFFHSGLPPTLFVRTLSVRHDSDSYRHSLFLRIPSIRPHLFSISLRHWPCRLKIPNAIITVASCNSRSTTNSSDRSVWR